MLHYVLFDFFFHETLYILLLTFRTRFHVAVLLVYIRDTNPWLSSAVVREQALTDFSFGEGFEVFVKAYLYNHIFANVLRLWKGTFLFCFVFKVQPLH